MKKNNRGISLMEVVVTMGIIILLAGLIIPATGMVRNHSKQTETTAEMAQLDTALIAYFGDNGSFPTSVQSLMSLKDEYFNFDSERTSGNLYNDAFGKAYLYLSPGVISSKGYDLFSLGLLRSRGANGMLSKIMAAASSTIFTSNDETNIKIGNPTGLGDETIWNLPTPKYNDLVKAMLDLLRKTDQGFNLAAMINMANIPIELADLSGTGALAFYDSDTHEIFLDATLAEIGPIEGMTAILAHEATHMADNLTNGSIDFDSVEEEYDAFYNSAKVWEQLRDDREVPLSNTVVTAEMNFVENFIEAGEKTAKQTIRNAYHSLPENDQYGDAYVVAKR